MEVDALLGGLKLASLVVKGGVSMIHLDLPMPSGEVPIRISGGASEITVHRPKGVAARAHLKGWVSTFALDDQTFGNVGNNLRLQSAGFDPTAPYYDIEVASSASMVTITSGCREKTSLCSVPQAWKPCMFGCQMFPQLAGTRS